MKFRMLAATAAIAVLAHPAAAQVRVEARIDLSGDQAAVTRQAEALADALTGNDGKVVELDMTIIPAVAGETPEYGVTLGRGEDAKPLLCDNSWERLETPTTFRVGFNGAYNHLLLSVLHTDPLSAPQVTVACEYAGGDQPAFHLRGPYVVSVVSIPTANDVELRPVLGPPR